MDFAGLAQHIADFLTNLYKLLENVFSWAKESADTLSAE